MISTRPDPFIFISKAKPIKHIKWNKLDFFQYCNQQATPCSNPQHLIGQIQFTKETLVAATIQMPDHT